MKFATKAIQQYLPHLRHVATLPWEIKNSIFCRYSAYVEEDANKLHFECTGRSADCHMKRPRTSFLSVKNTKSVADCGKFWSRSLARFMRAAQFASVSSCAQRLLKHLRCKSLQIIWDTDDWWIPVSRDISRTVLWVCGLSSWLRTQSMSQRFRQCGHKLIVKVNKQKNSDTENLIYNQHGKDSLFKRRKYQNLWMNNKVRGD